MRVTDSSQAVIISFLPTSFKSPHYLRPMRARDTAYFESYATDVFITLCLSPCSVEGCWQGENSVALINIAINFGYEYFSFVIYFSTFFFVKNFFQNFCFKIFFPKLFFKIFFLKCFSQNFFSKHFFPTSFQNLFFDGFTLDALPSTETKRTLCICVMKNMIYRPVWQTNIAFRLHHTKFSVLRLILRPDNHTIFSFKIQN